jgi:hypothetical protein
MRRFLKVCVGTAAVVAGAFGLSPVSAQAQELSEKSVRAFMDYAWSLTPAKFTKPDGNSVLIDKKDRSKVDIPVDIARDVIKAGRITAHAQICELAEDQVNNYRSLMKREEARKKWTEQQLIYISQLHLTTVMLLTGKVRLVAQEDGGQQAVLEEGNRTDAKTCTEEQRKKVRELITAYVKAGPPLAQPEAAAAAAQAPGPVKK